ncbi:Der GTPase-activating protein YihI [Planctobacterium marinum]|uniref:Der GTPase-activating protein YihI n=1 Tax=Planctobacterium marinum TaxID=1631968 RepID=UPI001E5036CB|nr:Der GTPase-activating protein YihI [Planctobacterium marinum]MCC2607223.1 GTPase-activating protein [Planctobacterium marinum]
MPRVKKSRKVTQSLPRAKPKLPKGEIVKKTKKGNGKAPGSRNSLVEEKAKKQQGGVHGTNADKRHGSKKKISLFAAGPSREDNTRLIPKFKSPLEELNFIENDKRLQSLIDKLDSGKKVDSQDQHYVEHLLKRHKTLCELLGIEDDEEADLDDDSPDLLDKLEQPFSDRF